MPERLTIETFADKVGHTFRLTVDETQAYDTQLIEARPLRAVTASGRPPAVSREPFSLLFLGPPVPHLPQRIYRLEHDTIGAHDIFLVPIARRTDGLVYEAIFS